MLLLKSFKAFP